MSPFTKQLKTILLNNVWFADALAAVRKVNPPDWYVGGGVIRTLVWDYLHGYEKPTTLRDVDVAFFDADDLSEARERFVEGQLRSVHPDVPWEARNQAAVHTWYRSKFGNEVEPLGSSAEGVATWPETATAIGVRLEPDDSLTILAPCGLDDLFNLILRRNPKRVTVKHFRERYKSKQILEKWPKVRIIDK